MQPAENDAQLDQKGSPIIAKTSGSRTAVFQGLIGSTAQSMLASLLAVGCNMLHRNDRDSRLPWIIARERSQLQHRSPKGDAHCEITRR